MISCENKKDTLTDFDLPPQQIETKLSGELIKSRILSFEQKLKKSENQASLRNDDTSIDETIWGIEALLNIYFSSNPNKIIESTRETHEITIPISNNNVNSTDLVQAYLDSWEKLMIHYNSFNLSGKKLFSLDLNLKSTNSGEAVVEVSTLIGTNQPVASPLNCDVFNAEDNWIAGNPEFATHIGEGRCDGTALGSNGAVKLTQKLNNNFRDENPLISPYPNASFLVGFIDIVISSRNGVEYENDDDEIFDNDRDYLMWVIDGTLPSNNYDEAKCIPYEDMSWYYCNIGNIIIPQIIDSYPNPSSTNEPREFISVEVFSEFLDNGQPDPWTFHALNLEHGSPVWISDIGWGKDPTIGALEVIDIADLTTIVISNPCPSPNFPC